MERAQLCREIQALERGKTTRIPQPVRERVLAYAREQRAGGKSWDAIAREMGVSSTALHRWSKHSAGPRRLARIRVKADAATSATVSLVSPQGYRIEGMSLDQALAALAKLS